MHLVSVVFEPDIVVSGLCVGCTRHQLAAGERAAGTRTPASMVRITAMLVGLFGIQLLTCAAAQEQGE